MKQFRYRSTQKSTGSNNVDKESKTKEKNLRQPVFYIFLIILIAFLAFIIKNYSDNRSSGKVVGDNIQTKLKENSKVLNYYVKPGDTIHKGDTLFKYKNTMNVTLPASYFICQYNGTVSIIYKSILSLIKNNEVIMDLSDIDKVFIQALIKKDAFDTYPKRKLVTVYFPNGIESYGRISDKNIQLVIDKTKTDENKQLVRVEVTPVNEKDLFIWKKYFKQDVEISK